MKGCLLALGIALGVLGTLLARSIATQPGELSEKDRTELARLHSYCDLVRIALALDAEELASSDPERREAAAQRSFGATPNAYRSDYEIRLCAVPPPNLHERTGCWIKHDYACLSRLAKLRPIASLRPRRVASKFRLTAQMAR